MRTAFQLTTCDSQKIENINVVYPKQQLKLEAFVTAFDSWFNTELHKYSNDYSILNTTNVDDEGEQKDGVGGGEEGMRTSGEEEGSNRNWFSKSKRAKPVTVRGNIVDVLNDNKMDRDVKINLVNKTLNTEILFPSLQGDKVTFIGSTFWRYGDKAPYLNHCAVLDTCSDLPNVENSKIDCYKTESDVLIAWHDLIEKKQS